MGRGSITASLRGMGRGSAGTRLWGMGRGSAGARLRGMGRGNDAKTALGVIKETKDNIRSFPRKSGPGKIHERAGLDVSLLPTNHQINDSNCS